MSLAFLFFGRRDTGIRLGGLSEFFLEYDLTLEESHEYPSEVTSFPVEDGAEVSDNIRNLPERVSVTGFVTNTPPNLDAIGALLTDRAQDAFNKLKQLRDAKELVDIVTTLELYTDMAIENISFPRSRESRSALFFEINFKHVEIVGTETVSTSSTDQAGGELDAGLQQAFPFAGTVPAEF